MLLLIARKYYDHKYGFYSKELANVKKVAETIRTLFSDFDTFTILTSPFESDRESAEFLKERLSINQEIKESELLIFTANTTQNISNLLDDLKDQNIIIVACQAVVAFLLKEERKRNLTVQTYENDLYLIE